MVTTVDFSVSATVEDGAFVGIIGSATEIGNWVLDGAKILHYNTTTGKWTKEIKFSRTGKVYYRYFIGLKVMDADGGERIIVNKWEACTRKISRYLKISGGKTVKTDDERFGIINGKSVVDDGWLCGQMEVRFIISQPGTEQIVSWLKPFANNASKTIKICFEPDGHVFNVRASLIKPFQLPGIKHSESVDLPKKDNEILMYIANIMEIGSFSGRFVISDSDGNVLGHANIVGNQLRDSVGYCTQVVVDAVGKAIGSLWCEYVVIKTYPGRVMDMEVGYHVHWKDRPTIHGGHRGSGDSFTAATPSDIHENTIYSFKNAALHGADIIEFDVLLSKDGIPVIFHDFTVCTNVKSKTGQERALHEVQVNSLAHDELQDFSTRHRSRKYGKIEPSFPEDATTLDLKSFPTLQEVFEEVPEYVAFDIELKWPHYHVDNTWDQDVREFGDANDFINKILDVVFRCAKERRVVFSCFDANICTMLRRKQNRYPVAFLTNGDYDTGTPYMDLRCRSNALAVPFAVSEKFLALATSENDAYANPELAKKTHDAGLKYFVYGEDIAKQENRDLLTKQGVDCIIYDRIHHVLPKGPNAFLKKN